MERLDEIGFGGYSIFQDDSCFLYGTDAVILSGFTAKYMKAGKKNCIDLGTNTGIVPTIILSKRPDILFTGVEMQERGFILALKGAEHNGLTEKLRFINSDILDLKDKVQMGSFDIVTMNPPYLERGTALSAESGSLDLARIESTATIHDFLKTGAMLLKEKGELFMVNRPYRMVEIMSYARSLRLEAKRLQLISPKRGTNPNLMLISFVKGGGKELTVLPEIAVRNADNSFTDEFQNEFRQF